MPEIDKERRRKRARQACVSCNARRVRCDVVESQPCHNCMAANVICETRASKRGKHSRKPKVAPEGSGSLVNNEVKTDSTPASQVSPHHHDDELAASHVLASLSTFHEPANIEQRSVLEFGSQSIQPQAIPPASHPEPEEDHAVYLGESNSLRYVTEVNPRTAPPTRRLSLLRHSVPNTAKADAIMPTWEAERKRNRIEALHADGAFSFPPFSTASSLLKAYFRWFHPNFAIVDESNIWNKHAEGKLSPLLLQAMLFIGVIHCDEATLTELNWGSRHRAKYLFYTRAKDIYDAEFETNKVTVIQALFLMSFRRAGALLEKDARHWLGTAITLAQTKALHRHAGDLEPRVESLRRRIWWSIYVRERQCSSSLGLPNRIRDEDCDIKPLSRTDFDNAFFPSTPGRRKEIYIAYAIGLMELTFMLGKIVDTAYLPNRTMAPAERDRIREELQLWKQNLPPTMQLSSDSGEHPSFQASMLHLAYNNLLILLHRSAFISNENNAEVANIALQAAARNSRIVEDLLPTGNIGHAQMHVITNLFNTLCIHVAHLRRTSGINKTITEHRAKLCLLGLQDLQKTWEVTNWVLQLFFQYLDRATAARLEMEADDIGITSAVKTQHSHTPNAAPDAGTLFPSASTRTAAPFDASHHHLGDETAHPQSHTPLNKAENEADGASMTPWSWTTDEANNYLFSQIESDFAFGEGGMLEWSRDEIFGAHLGSYLPELEYDNPGSGF